MYNPEDEEGELPNGISKLTVYALVNKDKKLEIHFGDCRVYTPDAKDKEDAVIMDMAAKLITALMCKINSNDENFIDKLCEWMDKQFDSIEDEAQKDIEDAASQLIKESLKKRK